MNILIVSSFLPYPLYSGGHIRLYNLIKRLSQKHTITLVSEMRKYQTDKDVEEVKKICSEVVTVPRGTQWSIPNIVKTLFSSSPFLVTGHTHKNMQDVLKKLLQEKHFDLVHVETFYVAQNLPQKLDVPLVIVEHNIEYTIYQQFSKKALFFLRPFLSHDVQKLQNAEEAWWKKANYVIAVSQEEKTIIERYNTRVAIVPNGVDLERFKLKDVSIQQRNKVKTVLFIGDFSYIQNKDAATFIIREIAPLVEKLLKDIQITFWIKGRKIPQVIKNLSQGPDIIYDESETLSTPEIFTKADLLLAPIRIGGGTQYKILEAMGCGTPVITTRLGNEGIHAHEDLEVLLGETAEELAEQCRKIFTNDTLYATVARGGRTLVEYHFDWEMITQQLENVYLEVVKKH